MSVRFYNKYNQLIEEVNETSGRVEENTLSNDIILYVEVLNGEMELTFELQDKMIGKWFPYQYDDGIEIVEYKRNFIPGKYRIILPTTKNEDKIAVNYNGNDVLDANIYIVPNFTQY
jgi:hypothetical protein